MTETKQQTDKNPAQKQRVEKPTNGLTENPPLLEGASPLLIQRVMADPRSLSSRDVLQLQSMVGNRAVRRALSKPSQSPPQTKPAVESQENRTGLPDNLKTGVESLSGVAVDDVKVHYNSAKPAQIQALAYAQGTDIHVGPGQEKHLPHEAWHVVQQKQGRVKPTLQAKGVAIDDSQGLEHEADVMGAKAYQHRQPVSTQNGTSASAMARIQPQRALSLPVVQRKWVKDEALPGLNYALIKWEPPPDSLPAGWYWAKQNLRTYWAIPQDYKDEDVEEIKKGTKKPAQGLSFDPYVPTGASVDGDTKETKHIGGDIKEVKGDARADASRRPLLTVKTEDGPTYFGNGSFEWKASFNLPVASEHGGYAVQKIVFTDTTDATNVTFWEAFRIDPGNTKSQTDGYMIKRDDVKTEGELKVMGQVSFFPLTHQELKNKGFKIGNEPIAGLANSTHAQPDFWRDEGADHNLRVKWKATDPVMKPPELETTPGAKWDYALEAKAENPDWTDDREREWQAAEAKRTHDEAEEKARTLEQNRDRKVLTTRYEIEDWVAAQGRGYKAAIEAVMETPGFDIWDWLLATYGVTVSNMTAKSEGIAYLYP